MHKANSKMKNARTQRRGLLLAKTTSHLFVRLVDGLSLPGLEFLRVFTLQKRLVGTSALAEAWTRQTLQRIAARALGFGDVTAGADLHAGPFGLDVWIRF